MNRLNRLAVARGLSDVHCDQLARSKVAADFDRVSVVVADRHFDQFEMVVTHDRQINFVVAEYERVVRRCQAGGRDVRGHLHVRVHSRQQRPILIWQIDLDQHRARGLIESLGMARDRAGEFAVGKIDDGYRRGIAVLDERRNALRDVCINPERRQRGQRDDGGMLRSSTTGSLPAESTCPDRRSVRLRYRRRTTALPHTVASRVVAGRPLWPATSRSATASAVCCGTTCWLNEFLIADVGNVLNPVERTRIRHLLVRLRRFDQRDNLSGLDVVALVDVDGLHVSGDLRVDRSLDVAVDAGRKLDRPRRDCRRKSASPAHAVRARRSGRVPSSGAEGAPAARARIRRRR